MTTELLFPPKRFYNPCSLAYILPYSLLLHNNLSCLTHTGSAPGMSPGPYLPSLLAGHSQLTLKAAWPVCTRVLTGRQPDRRAKKKTFISPSTGTHRGATELLIYHGFKSYLKGERRKANRLFNHLRQTSFGKQAKEERIQKKFLPM